MFIFPFPILNSLKFTQLREKIGLGLIFALGFFTILVSTGRFMFMLFLTNDISLCEHKPETCFEGGKLWAS